MLISLFTQKTCFIQFEKSRGKEDDRTRQFMRASVIVSDLLTYIPVMTLFALTTTTDWRPLLTWTLLQPALLLIDHGHFQFNGVALGLVALAVLLVHTKHELWGSAMFVLALNFKHMALYFAPPFFFVLLGRNVALWRDPLGSVLRVGLIGVVVIGTFALVWAPFLANGTALNVLTRLFPVSRGIFEDKVANLWCATGPIFRFKERFSADLLFRFAAVATLVAMAPSCVMLVRRPSSRMFLLSLANVSLAFFLLAFQVHEKSILMPLLPLSMLWSSHRHAVTVTTAVACFSMFPLLERDGLALQYAIVMVVLAWLSWRWRSSSVGALLQLATGLAIVSTHLLMAFVDPPRNLPHLWIMLCMVVSFAHFSCVFLWLLWLQYIESRKIEKHD